MRKARIPAIIGYALIAAGRFASRIRTAETGGAETARQILAVTGVLAGAVLVTLAALADLIAISKLAKTEPAYRKVVFPATATLAFAAAATALQFFRGVSIWRIAAAVLLYLFTALTAALIFGSSRWFAGAVIVALAAAASIATVVIGRMKETTGVVAATGQKVTIGGPKPALAALPAALMLIAHAIFLAYLLKKKNKTEEKTQDR